MTAEGILAQTSEPDFKDRVPAALVSHAQRVMTRADVSPSGVYDWQANAETLAQTLGFSSIAMTISSFRALLQISHKQSEFSGKSEILGFFGEYAAYCDRERGTLYRGARLRGAPPDYRSQGQR
jgi:hypothetical protein